MLTWGYLDVPIAQLLCIHQLPLLTADQSDLKIATGEPFIGMGVFKSKIHSRLPPSRPSRSESSLRLSW